jgi:AraC-like DNA-binding protein
MKRLFTPVDFQDRLVLWDHRTRSDTPIDGYYHWHPCCELLFMHEGEGTVIVKQQTYEIKRGMLFIFPPFQLHKVFPRVLEDRPYVRSKLHFHQEELSDKLAAFPLRSGLITQVCEGQGVPLAYDLAQEMDELELIGDWHQRSAIEGREEESLLFLLQLSGILHRRLSYSSEHRVVTQDNRALRYSEKIMKWIDAHYAEEASLEQLAEELHLSKFYVSRVFRQETGSSITDYLTARRIKQACRLLQTTTLPVEQIGIQVGLPDGSYFIQLFKKVVGTTPLKYRNQ